MSAIFLSYARSTEAAVRQIAGALRAVGHEVWWDEELPGHGAYADAIEEKLRAAKAVIVVWSADAVKSQWVRAEADAARNAGTLVQLSLDGCIPPLPFNQYQCANLSTWNGNTKAQAWRKLLSSVDLLLRRAPRGGMAPAANHANALPRETLLAVMAFDNLSNDVDLAYFSDGVSEEILCTIARARGLRVIGKASSFQLRGADKTAANVAEVLGATHMLDGSVRRAGDNIRIRAELVDTATLETLWSERYDRALTDIFALQDEIASSISEALDHHFAPAKAPITIDPVAYDLYLQARAIYAQDLTWADQARCIRLLESAVSRAPNFAQAWGRLAVYLKGDAAIEAARRGLELDADCAVSLAALALTKPSFSDYAEKLALTERAYSLVPDDQLVAGIYSLVLMAVGLVDRVCNIADARADRDPLSPLVAGSRIFAYRSAGSIEQARAIAAEAVRDFPDSDYLNFVRGAIAVIDGDVDEAATILASRPIAGDATSLNMLVLFFRTVTTMDPSTRAIAVGEFLKRSAPVSSLVDIGLAAAVGEVDLAIEHLLDTIRAGRPIDFAADNDGRGPTGATVTAGLFMANCEVLRSDVRFSEICVRLGLYAFWIETGLWPDCAEELKPFYDLKAECARYASIIDANASTLGPLQGSRPAAGVNLGSQNNIKQAD